MREVSAHAQNDNRSVAVEIFSVGTYFPNTPRIYHNEILNKKYTMFITVSHHGWTQTQRMFTANCWWEETCTN
jgi:hypothetical protein